jgi:hypothetical protein
MTETEFIERERRRKAVATADKNLPHPCPAPAEPVNQAYWDTTTIHAVIESSEHSILRPAELAKLKGIQGEGKPLDQAVTDCGVEAAIRYYHGQRGEIQLSLGPDGDISKAQVRSQRFDRPFEHRRVAITVATGAHPLRN